MKGHPVWFLPLKETGTTALPDDIESTPQNTITVMLGQNVHANEDIYELTYSGDVLWKGPNNGSVSGDSIEHYHHDFTRLTNGHYMTLASEYKPWRKQEFAGDTLLQKVPFGTLIEYDEHGNLVWAWKSFDYFKTSDFVNYSASSLDYADPHDNAFYFDEKENAIYISYKFISRIVKIKYPEGTILNVYGKTFPANGEEIAEQFCGQHSCRRSKDGYLYMFNNNAADTTGKPRITMLREPASAKEAPVKVWEYQYEGTSDRKMKAAMGGSVMELPSGSMFVAMCRPYSDVFIVNRNKEITWSAILERWNPVEKKWMMFPRPQYRASMVTSRKELEQMIWKTGQSRSGGELKPQKQATIR
jgi:hypothetical protein